MNSETTNVKRIEQTVRHALLLALLYLLPTAQSLLPIEDPDIWWHLRTGQWIIEHGTVPRVDYFSTYGLGKPWVAYSWLFEVLVYKLFDWFGLPGLILFKIVLGLALALAIHLLIQRARLSLGQEIVLAAAVLVCLKSLMNPRAWLFSILFFTLELTLILRFRQSRDSRGLWWLPVLFVLWSNIHIQFIYGIAVLMMLVFESVVQGWLTRFGVPTIPSDAALPFRTALLLLASCLLATLINPYHIDIYKPILEVIWDTKAFDMISELRAPSFRFLDNWFALVLLVSVTFCLGWRHERRFFPLGLMVMGLYLSFRARRDVWVGALACVAVMVDWPRPQSLQLPISYASASVASLLVAFGIVYFTHSRQISEPELSRQLARKYPADAVQLIKSSQQPQTIFNHYDWGGFLIWHLPKFLVSMDGRSNLHTEDRVERNIDIWMGRPGWNKDLELTQASLVLGPVGLPLVTLLRTDNRFKLCYEDKVAAVFVAVRYSQRGKCPR